MNRRIDQEQTLRSVSILLGMLLFALGACHQIESGFDEAETDCWPAPADNLYMLGSTLYAKCKACHSLNGRSKVGPSWRGLWDTIASGEVEFTDGTILGDLMGEGKMFTSPEDYLFQSIINPQQKIVVGYEDTMPTFKGQLNAMEIMALSEFIKNLDRFDEEGNLLYEAEGLAITARP